MFFLSFYIEGKITSFSDWFARNGKPKAEQKGMLSSFKASKRYVIVYFV